MESQEKNLSELRRLIEKSIRDIEQLPQIVINPNYFNTQKIKDLLIPQLEHQLQRLSDIEFIFAHIDSIRNEIINPVNHIIYEKTQGHVRGKISFAELLKFFRFNKKRESSNIFTFKIPSVFRTSFQQYIFYFKDYVFLAKGIKINMEVKQNEYGLELKILEKKELRKKIEKWFGDYINYVTIQTESLLVNFERKVSIEEADLIVKELRDQIRHLKNSLTFAELKNQYYSEEVDFLRKLSIESFKSKSDRELLVNNTHDYSKIKMTIGSGDFKKAVEDLLKIVKEKSPNTYNELIMIYGRVNNIEMEIRHNLISEDASKVERSKIAKSILEIIDRLNKF